MIEITFELFELGSNTPFSVRQITMTKQPNIFEVMSVLSKHFGDVNPAFEIGKIIIEKVDK